MGKNTMQLKVQQCCEAYQAKMRIGERSLTDLNKIILLAILRACNTAARQSMGQRILEKGLGSILALGLGLDSSLSRQGHLRATEKSIYLRKVIPLYNIISYYQQYYILQSFYYYCYFKLRDNMCNTSRVCEN